MTVKLYDDHPYDTSFTAEVVSCTAAQDGTFEIILDRTLFFPEEGGQSPDTGTLNCQGTEINVTDIQIDRSGTILHTTAFPIPEGSSVTGVIDWEHRFRNMQQHTGEHIFSGIVNSLYGLDNVGFHLSDNEMTVDYNGALSESDIRAVEDAANRAVFSNIPVSCRYPGPDELKSLSYRSKKEIEGAVRIVSIPGIDTCACCAPHVRMTGEVGIIKVTGFQSHRGGTRIWILCGLRALEEFTKLQEAAGIVSREYSVPADPSAITEAIRKRNDQMLKLKDRVSVLQSSLLDKEISLISPDEPDILLFVSGLDEVQKRSLLNEQVKLRSGLCCVFDGSDSDGYSFIIASSSLDCNDALKPLRERFGARGGGKSMMVQGSLKASQEEIREVLAR